jgi:Holliday junction resolvase RusA-like endonuclease
LIMRQESDKKTTYALTLEGNPIAQARPRITRFGRAYDPKAKEKKEARIKIMQQMADKRVLKRLGGPIAVELGFHTALPQSWSKRKKNAFLGEFNFSRTGDLDNLAKFYLDAMNDLLFKDDAQIVVLHCEKRYAEKPRVDIRIEEL